VATPAVAGVVEEDVAALKLAHVADVTPANAIKVRNENLRGSDLRIPQNIQPGQRRKLYNFRSVLTLIIRQLRDMMPKLLIGSATGQAAATE
jgi:hypothetical protein